MTARMRKAFRLLAGATLLLGVASSVHAAPGTVTGTLTLQLGTLPGIPLSGGGTINVNGSGGGTHFTTVSLPSGLFAGTVLVPITDTALSMTIMSLAASISNRSGTFFSGTGSSNLNGTLGLNGTAFVCLYAPCGSGLTLTVPFTVNAGATGVGIGGTITAPGLVDITLRGLGPWTQGTATVMNIDTAAPTQTFTAMGFAHGPRSGTSSTNAPGGVVQLVTPLDIRTSLTTAFPQIPSFAFITIHVVPEPGTLLLLGSGPACLVALGRRRTRK